MIDHPEKTARLLAALKAATPFEVELVPTLVNYLRAQRIAVADQTRHVVSDVSYVGDEAASCATSFRRKNEMGSLYRSLKSGCRARCRSLRSSLIIITIG